MKQLFLFIFFLFFVSCPGLIQAPPAEPGSGIPIGIDKLTPIHPEDQENPGNNQNPPLNLPLNRKWGLVSCEGLENWDFKKFSDTLGRFLSTSADPSSRNWWIKCDFNNPSYKNWKGGFFIRGGVAFQTGKFNPESQSQNLIPSSSSHLEIHLVDYLGKTVINPIKMNINELSSSITGTNVDFIFKDQKGEVHLQGTAQRNPKINDWTIKGQMSFKNYIYYNSSQVGESGFLGYFEIPACSFLDCERQLSSPPQGL